MLGNGKSKGIRVPAFTEFRIVGKIETSVKEDSGKNYKEDTRSCNSGRLEKMTTNKVIGTRE